MDLCGLFPGAGGRDLAANEQANDTDGNNKDDGEHDDDTSFLLSPVLALGDVGESVASNDGGVDGRHFGGY